MWIRRGALQVLQRFVAIGCHHDPYRHLMEFDRPLHQEDVRPVIFHKQEDRGILVRGMDFL